VRATELGCAVLVEVVEVGDGEPGSGDGPCDGERESAATEQALFKGVESALPALHRIVRRQTVFDEVERAAGFEHPAYFGEGSGWVGDRAQGPGRQRRVAAVVGEG